MIAEFLTGGKGEIDAKYGNYFDEEDPILSFLVSILEEMTC